VEQRETWLLKQLEKKTSISVVAFQKIDLFVLINLSRKYPSVDSNNCNIKLKLDSIHSKQYYFKKKSLIENLLPAKRIYLF